MVGLGFGDSAKNRYDITSQHRCIGVLRQKCLPQRERLPISIESGVALMPLHQHRCDVVPGHGHVLTCDLIAWITRHDTQK